MDSTQPGDNADDRIAQEISNGEASVHGDMSGLAIVADGISTLREEQRGEHSKAADVAVRSLGCARLPRGKPNKHQAGKCALYCAATNATAYSSHRMFFEFVHFKLTLVERRTTLFRTAPFCSRFEDLDADRMSLLL